MHDQRIREQLTRRAALFAAAPQIRDQEALGTLIELTRPGADQRALDVACGPGIVACAHAPHAGREAANVSWRLGDSRRLPFAEGRGALM